ncbi:MAG: hypothetical protein ACREOW_02100 [Thermodesulfobacteriota bacterium]
MKANGEKKKGQLKKNGKPKEKKNGSVKKENPKEKKNGLMKTGAAINPGKKNGLAKKNGEGMKTGSMKIGLGKVASSILDSLLFSLPSSASSVKIISSFVRDSSSIVSAYVLEKAKINRRRNINNNLKAPSFSFLIVTPPQ